MKRRHVNRPWTAIQTHTATLAAPFLYGPHPGELFVPPVLGQTIHERGVTSEAAADQPPTRPGQRNLHVDTYRPVHGHCGSHPRTVMRQADAHVLRTCDLRRTGRCPHDLASR